jgi:tripartite-type tricarboxylate transporter receptor subunit TctC
VPGYAVPDTWFGFAGPANLPRPIVERLNAEIRKAVQDPEVQKRIENLGMVPSGTATPDQLAASVRAETEAIRRIVAAAGIQPE